MIDTAIVIPTLLCAAGILIWNLGSYAKDSERIRLRSRGHVRVIADRTNVRSRLNQLNRGSDYENFRIRQILRSAMAAVAAFLIILATSGELAVASTLGGIVACGIYFLIDRELTMEVIKRRRAIEGEFAPIIEMLTLSLSAGESPLSAMTRISLRSHGILGEQFTQVIDSVRAGHSFHDSLDALGRRVDSVVIRRFVDSLITAMLRGAPLIEVLQRHAAEARQNQRNLLMDKAGKAEISMMVPVVFLILPISVLFALWPSLTHLNLFAG